jgi:benzoylformate decarboxylase
VANKKNLQARSILPFEPFLLAERAPEFPRPYVKWSCEPARTEDVPAAIARAYYTAMQPPCGPTFVSIPVDDWDRLCEPLPAAAGIMVRSQIVKANGDPVHVDYMPLESIKRCWTGCTETSKRKMRAGPFR